MDLIEAARQQFFVDRLESAGAVLDYVLSSDEVDIRTKLDAAKWVAEGALGKAMARTQIDVQTNSVVELIERVSRSAIEEAALEGVAFFPEDTKCLEADICSGGAIEENGTGLPSSDSDTDDSSL